MVIKIALKTFSTRNAHKLWTDRRSRVFWFLFNLCRLKKSDWLTLFTLLFDLHTHTIPTSKKYKYNVQYRCTQKCRLLLLFYTVVDKNTLGTCDTPSTSRLLTTITSRSRCRIRVRSEPLSRWMREYTQNQRPIIIIIIMTRGHRPCVCSCVCVRVRRYHILIKPLIADYDNIV